ncbi:MAG: hypothetical protein GY765_39620, partial [bacterium]|nr:hypothetical protein [bacterium]
NHHILYDGWSNGILLKEFFLHYRNLVAGTPIEPRQKTSFKDFVRRCREPDDGEAEKYWREYLRGIPTHTAVPLKSTGHRKPSAHSGALRHADDIHRQEVKHLDFVYPAEKKKRMAECAAAQKITAASFFYCTWGLLLQKYTDTRDVVLYDGSRTIGQNKRHRRHCGPVYQYSAAAGGFGTGRNVQATDGPHQQNVVVTRSL